MTGKGRRRTDASVKDARLREALDFSLDSGIREPLLARIMAECDELSGLNAAGNIGEAPCRGAEGPGSCGAAKDEVIWQATTM